MKLIVYRKEKRTINHRAMYALATCASIPKILLLIFIYVCPLSAFSAQYFVSATDGNDTYSSAQAQNLATPWKTIQKAASMMYPGDSCLIRGGTYRETVTPPRSGMPSAPITFRPYGTEVVIVSGADPVTGWTTSGGNIWNAPMGWTMGDGNQVFIANVMKPEARWPNAGPSFPWQDSSLAHPTNNELGDWSYVNSAGYDANNQNGWLTDSQLPDRTNGHWVGATVHIMSGHGWIMAHPTVTAYNSGTKTIVTNDNNIPGAYRIKAGNEFYLTGIKAEMDAPGEWFYNNGNSTLSLYATATPSGVTAKRRYYGFNLSGRTHIHLIDLSFFACTVQSNASTANITYDGLDMKYTGHSRKNSTIYGLVLRNGDVLRNSDLSWDSRALIHTNGAGTGIRVINNNLHNSGYTPYWDAMVQAGGEKNLFSHNTLKDSGRGLMGNPGRASIFQYNDLVNGMRLTTDGALFYTFVEAGNTVVRFNRMRDSVGPQGHTGHGLSGFYLDRINSGWVIHHNLIYNISNGYAMQINNRQNFNKIFNNTTWNTERGSLLSDFPMSEEAGTQIYNNLFTAPPTGVSWGLSDIRFNLFSDPLFTDPAGGNFTLQSNSPANNAGVFIPGVTNIGPGTAVGQPDVGALEFNGVNWTTQVGYKTSPPSPDPIWANPTLTVSNQVVDGSFESGVLAPNWTTAPGSVVTMRTGYAWNDYFLRSDSKAIQFGVGTSEVRQVVTGLLPGRRYKVFGGVRRPNDNSTVKLGVRNFGGTALETTASQVNDSGGDSARHWTMYSRSFMTGTTNTTAEIYLNVSIPSGGGTVHADDFGLQLAVEPGDVPIPMPIAQLSFSEATGSVALDSTLNGNDGTIYGGAIRVAGIVGNALHFNGTDSYVRLPAAVPAAPTGSFSVAFWVKFDTIGTGTPALLSNTNGLFKKKGWQVMANADRLIGLLLWTQDNASSGGSPPTEVALWAPASPVNTWTHVTYVIDQASHEILMYSNASLLRRTPIPVGFAGVETSNGLQVGHTTLSGAMDEVQVHNRALDPEEVSALFNSGPTLPVHLQLGEAAGSTAAWNSGSGVNGVLNNINPATAWQDDALRFDGVDDFVTVAENVPTASADSFSVAFWVKFEDSGSGTPVLVANNNGVWKKKGWEVIANANRSIGLYLWTSDNPSASSSPPSEITLWGASVPVNKWTHVAWTADRATNSLTHFRDGNQVGVISIPDGFADVITTLGTRIGSPAFKGLLSDVRVYGRSLTGDEVMKLVIPYYAPPYEAPSFNGINDFVSFSENVPASLTESFSVAFWVKFDNVGSGVPALLSNSSGWKKKGWRVMANAERKMGIYLWTNDNPSANGTPPSEITLWGTATQANTWTHVACALRQIE